MKYKIAILIDQLIIGGVQKIALEDARVLSRMGHDVEVVALMKKGYDPANKSFTEGVKIKFLSDYYPKVFRNSIKFPVFSFFSTLHLASPFLAPAVIKNKQYDIIISHGTTTCFTAQALKQRRGIPYLALIHDPMNYILNVSYSGGPLKFLFPMLKPVLRKLEKNLIEHSSEVVLLSNLHKNYVSKTYNTKTVIVPAATRIPQYVNHKNRNAIIASTRWEEGKNPGLLLKIAQNIPEANVKIAGTWSSAKEYLKFRKAIKSAGLSGRVRLYPNISEKRLANLYQQARFFVHPIKEAFGMGGLEAAVNACPIVVPQGSGITQYLKDGEDGIFVKSPNDKNFIEAAAYLWGKPDLAQKMGYSARKKGMEFSWENRTEKLLAIISKSLERPVTIVALETGHSSESYLSGGDKLLEKMVHYFPENFRLKVIAPTIGIEHWKKAGFGNVEIVTLSPTFFDNKTRPAMIFIAYIFRIWNTFWTLRKIGHFDILYSSTNVFPDVAPAYFYKLTNSKKIWMTRIHHLVSPPNRRPGRFLINVVSYVMQMLSNEMIRSKSNKIIALNKNLKKKLLDMGFGGEVLDILGAGIETEKVQKARKSVQSFDGVFLGRIHPTKGIYDIVDIWRAVVDEKPNSRAIVVGGGSREEERKLAVRIKKAALTKNLVLSGYLTDNQVYSTLKSSKVFLFCDHEAGWGLAIGEAMAAGLPVVGYDLDIFNDVYKKGFVTVPVGDTGGFAKQVLALLGDDDKYQTLKKESLEQAAKLSWSQTGKKFTAFVLELLGN